MEALRIIECLKKSGLEIKDIKQFFLWVSEGSASYEKRKELFETRKSAVETEIHELQKTLSLLKFKCWYYETAMKDGNEDAINAVAIIISTCLSGCKMNSGKIRFGSAGIGGTYQIFGDTFANLISSKSKKYNIEVKTTGGSAANLRLLSKDYIQMAVAPWI